MITNEKAIATEVSNLVDGVGAPIKRAAYNLRAKPSWITLSTVEGNGNASIDVTAPLYKGRNGRSGNISVISGELSEEVALSQEGSSIWDVTTPSLSFIKDGETKEFTGNTNLTSITYSVDSDASSWLSIDKITVNGIEYGSGAPFEGDPGATDIFGFSIKVIADSNDSIEIRTGHITINGQKYTVTQAAGDARLSVTPTSLTFAAAGETKQITISTNANWTIE